MEKEIKKAMSTLVILLAIILVTLTMWLIVDEWWAFCGGMVAIVLASLFTATGD